MRWTFESVLAYYRHEAVIERIREYGLGARGIAGYGGREELASFEHGPVSLHDRGVEHALRTGADVCRSMADRRGVLLHLDIDYVDPLEPAAPYRRSAEVFRRLQPAYRAAVAAFGARGLTPLALMTGRGYHLVVRVASGTPFHDRLGEIGRVDPPLLGKYQRLEVEIEGAVAMGRAHAGAGRLLEHLAHEIARRARGDSTLPVHVVDIPPPGCGPFVCLDLSAYADPLFERHLRAAFSLNQKALREGMAEDGVVVVLPCDALSLGEALALRENLGAAAGLARGMTAEIPDAPPRDGGWIDDYLSGPLGRFHREFDAGQQMAWRDWPVTYDALDLQVFPACVRTPLLAPNPLLLQPLHLRTVALVLWELGFPPRWVAGLIRSKYERHFGWGERWYRYDAAAHADFYVRVLCGARALGLDSPDPLDCSRLAASGGCPGDCAFDLVRLRHCVPSQEKNDGMGHRPLDRHRLSTPDPRVPARAGRRGVPHDRGLYRPQPLPPGRRRRDRLLAR
jgi:hypothetical protein